MNSNETDADARLAGLTRLTSELQQSRTPDETLRAFRRALADLYGPSTSLMLSTRGLADGEYRLLQLTLDGAAALDSDLWSQNALPTRHGGIVSQLIRVRQPQLIQRVDWSIDPYFHEQLAPYSSVIAIPIAGARLPMDWFILLQRQSESFTHADLEQSALRGAMIASLLERQSLAQEVAEAHAETDREVRRVGEIQRMLLPNPLPRIPGLEISASFETYVEAGGDLYDFVPLDGPNSESRRWAIFIGDASGHGPSAAVVIAIVQALLHSHPPGVINPAALLNHLNKHLCQRPIAASFVTAFLCVYEPTSRRLSYAVAGHPPPLLRRSSREMKHLDHSAGCPLGIDDETMYQEAAIELEPGDILLLYTDGIEEARDSAGAMFGINGIEAIVRGTSPAAEAVVSSIREAITAHARGRPPNDDQTIVAIRVL